MALHHRANFEDMRHAYDSEVPRRQSEYSESYRSYHSDASDKSYHTSPTEYSSYNSPTKRPPHVHYNTCESKVLDAPKLFFEDRHQQESPRTSVDTYASTIPSEEELQETHPGYDVPEYTARPYGSQVMPATPSDFSELFPSCRRLTVHHDDSTVDGNMNLRIDTHVFVDDRECDMTLFHLRLHDLKKREFSLRRYCRDSGREVCHTTRKVQKQPAQRPGLPRSISNAFNIMRAKSESKAPTLANLADLKRNDSGYGSMHSVDYNEDHRPQSSGGLATVHQQLSSDTIKLEFSNYAQVEIKRTGSKSNKRYDLTYWGIHYAWRRIVRKDGTDKKVRYHLTKAGSDNILAHIVPAPLSPDQMQAELSKGGWIPPCSMWLADESIFRSGKDASDVLVASGLIAMVDDTIRAYFDSKRSSQALSPFSKLGMEYVGPKMAWRALRGEATRRETSATPQSQASTSTRPSTSSRPSTSGHSATSSRAPFGALRHHSYDR